MILHYSKEFCTFHLEEVVEVLFAPIKGVIAAFRCNQVLEAYHQVAVFKCALGSFCSQVHYCCLQI
jgi:hypothetical protein